MNRELEEDMYAGCKEQDLWSLTNTLEGLVIKEVRVIDGKLRLYLAKLTTEEVERTVELDTDEEGHCSTCDDFVAVQVRGDFPVMVDTTVIDDDIFMVLIVSLDSYEYLR